MKHLIATLILAAGLISAQANATCIGGPYYSTCSDQHGNNYDVMRYGNSTHMQGYNNRSGSRWSQDSMTSGNMTFHNGRAANGRTWNGTEIRNSDGSRMISGTDSRGNMYSKFCDAAGNCY